MLNVMLGMLQVIRGHSCVHPLREIFTIDNNTTLLRCPQRVTQIAESHAQHPSDSDLQIGT